jgi:hypothetical protein
LIAEFLGLHFARLNIEALADAIGQSGVRIAGEHFHPHAD